MSEYVGVEKGVYDGLSDRANYGIKAANICRCMVRSDSTNKMLFSGPWNCTCISSGCMTSFATVSEGAAQYVALKACESWAHFHIRQVPSSRGQTALTRLFVLL
jgi:hypothetical protein